MSEFKVHIREELPERVPRAGGLIRHAYLGLSIGSPFTRGRRLNALTRWVAMSTSECLILIGDRLARFTIMIRDGITESEAESRASAAGAEVFAQVSGALAQIPSEGTQIVRWKDLASGPRYDEASGRIAALFNESARFRELVRASAHDYLSRLLNRGASIAVGEAEALSLARQYLCEEIAAFDILLQDGWSTEVYPGPDLPALSALMRGEVSGGPNIFRERFHIEVAVESARGNP